METHDVESLFRNDDDDLKIKRYKCCAIYANKADIFVLLSIFCPDVCYSSVSICVTALSFYP